MQGTLRQQEAPTASPEDPGRQPQGRTPGPLGAALLLVLCAYAPLQGTVRASEPMPAATPASVAQVRIDGLYHHRDPEGRGDSFLRFYGDGQVFAVSSTGSPLKVMEWLGPGTQYASKGTYRIDGNALVFEATSESGRIDYAGTIAGTTLDLQVTSRINGHRSHRQYAFVPEASSTFGPSDPVAIDMPLPGQPRSATTAEGTAVVLVEISSTGAVTAASIETSSGVGEFDAAAVDAARKWTFRPARDAKGQAVAAKLRAPVTFKAPPDMAADIRSLMATSCTVVNAEVARIDAGAARKSAGATIDRGMGLVMSKQTHPRLATQPAYAPVPSLPEGALLAFMTQLTSTVEAIKSHCAAQPDAVFGDVLRQQLQALAASPRKQR